MTTLEEVFIKVAEIGSLEEREADRALSRQLSSDREHSTLLESKPGDDARDYKGSVNKAPAHSNIRHSAYSRDSAIQGESAFFFVSMIWGGCMDAWMDGWMDGWVDGCMDGWVTAHH